MTSEVFLGIFFFFKLGTRKSDFHRMCVCWRSWACEVWTQPVATFFYFVEEFGWEKLKLIVRDSYGQ